MNGETTFLDEFNATAPDLSREVNVIVYANSDQEIYKIISNNILSGSGEVIEWFLKIIIVI